MFDSDDFVSFPVHSHFFQIIKLQLDAFGGIFGDMGCSGPSGPTGPVGRAFSNGLCMDHVYTKTLIRFCDECGRISSKRKKKAMGRQYLGNLEQRREREKGTIYKKIKRRDNLYMKCKKLTR